MSTNQVGHNDRGTRSARVERTGGTRLGAACLVALAALAAAPRSEAEMTKDQCVDANNQGQTLRRDGKLAAARVQLQRCADPSCPGIVRDDCTQRLDEIERVQPTIVFDAKDGNGRDLVAVQVTMDGTLLAGKLEGKALRVDPGAHAFTFSVAGQPPLTQTFVVKEGEKERSEKVVIGVPAPSAAPPLSLASPSPESPRSSPGLGTERMLGLGAAGVGAVGVGLGAVFGVLASSAWGNAKSACGGDIGHCANVSSADSYKSTTVSDGTISTVGFVAGGLLLAGGAVLFFAAHHDEGTPAPTVSVRPAVAPGQGGVEVAGAF